MNTVGDTGLEVGVVIFFFELEFNFFVLQKGRSTTFSRFHLCTY